MTGIPYYEMYSGLGKSIKDVGDAASQRLNLVNQLMSLKKQQDFVHKAELSLNNFIVKKNPDAKPYAFPPGTTPDEAAKLLQNYAANIQLYDSLKSTASKQENAPGGKTTFALEFPNPDTPNEQYKTNAKERFDIWSKTGLPGAIETRLSEGTLAPGATGPTAVGGFTTKTGEDLPITETNKIPFTAKTAEQAFPNAIEALGKTTAYPRLKTAEEAGTTLTGIGAVEKQQATQEEPINYEQAFSTIISSHPDNPLTKDEKDYLSKLTDKAGWMKLFMYSARNRKDWGFAEEAKFYDVLSDNLLKTTLELGELRTGLTNPAITPEEKRNLTAQVKELEDMKKDLRDEAKISTLNMRKMANTGTGAVSKERGKIAQEVEKTAGETEKQTKIETSDLIEIEKMDILNKIKEEYPNGLSRTVPGIGTKLPKIININPEVIKNRIDNIISNSPYASNIDRDDIYNQFISFSGDSTIISKQNLPKNIKPSVTEIPGSSEKNPIPITGDDDYLKLSKGQWFIAPNGKLGQKK